MSFISREQRLVTRAYWMVRHRWIAILSVAIITWLSANLVEMTINVGALYLLDVGLIIENLITLWLLEFTKRRFHTNPSLPIRLIIHFQISCDLIILTGILYFTGGIENPFFFIYIFHMVISSVLLSRTGAFIQTTFALLLFGILVFLDLNEIIPHYCLCIKDLPNHQLYKDVYYVGRTFGVFAFVCYILVYLTTSIGHRLRNQEDKLTKAIEQLHRKDEIKNQYVLRITHDTKSHLAAIQTSLSVLTEGVFGNIEGKQKEFLNRAYKRTESLINFSRKLLHLSRLKLNNEIDKQEFSFREIIDQIISDCKELAEKKEQQFVVKIANGLDHYTGNKLSFIEVFENLISNAIKYSTTEGKIEINISAHFNEIKVEVIDSGMGISTDDLKIIFNEFQRGSNVIGTGIYGSGVGLSLVKKIINNHGGKIHAENRQNGGSKFIIYLPKSDT